MAVDLTFKNSGDTVVTDLATAVKAIYNDGTKEYKVDFYSTYDAKNPSGTRTAATGIPAAKVFVYADSTNKTEYIVDNSTSGSLTFKLMDVTTTATPLEKYSLSAGSSANLSNILTLLGSGTLPQLADKILGADDGNNKSVLVTKLGELLASNATPAQYDGATAQKPVEYLAAQGKLVTEGNLGTKVLNEGGTPITDVADLVTKLTTPTGTNGVYTKTAADAKFAVTGALSDYVQTSQLPAAVTKEVEKPDVAAKILGAKGADNKLVLVTKLADALDLNDPNNAAHKVYGTQGQEKIAKAFLGDKGLKPTAAEVAAETTLHTALAANPDLKAAVQISAAVNDPGFTGAVHQIMSSDYISGDPSDWNF